MRPRLEPESGLEPRNWLTHNIDPCRGFHIMIREIKPVMMLFSIQTHNTKASGDKNELFDNWYKSNKSFITIIVLNQNHKNEKGGKYTFYLWSYLFLSVLKTFWASSHTENRCKSSSNIFLENCHRFAKNRPQISVQSFILVWINF